MFLIERQRNRASLWLAPKEDNMRASKRESSTSRVAALVIAAGIAAACDAASDHMLVTTVTFGSDATGEPTTYNCTCLVDHPDGGTLYASNGSGDPRTLIDVTSTTACASVARGDSVTTSEATFYWDSNDRFHDYPAGSPAKVGVSDQTGRVVCSSR